MLPSASRSNVQGWRLRWSPPFIFSMLIALALKHVSPGWLWLLIHPPFWNKTTHFFPHNLNQATKLICRLNKSKYILSKWMSSAFLSAGKEETRSDAFWCGGAKKYNKIIHCCRYQVAEISALQYISCDEIEWQHFQQTYQKFWDVAR